MFPPVIGAVLIGSPIFDMMIAIFAIVMAWEWESMATGRQHLGGRSIIVILTGTAPITVATYHPLAALLVAGSGAIVAGLGAGGMWRTFGSLYIALPCIALVWLRTADGLETLLWLFIVVWSTDISAYSIGRCFGGPLLAPSISPGKTWAGALGGLGAAMGAGGTIAAFLDVSSWNLVIASAVTSVISQLGDLTESKIKRYFGVKDSSQIIPGHGGVFDRVDGILATAPLVVCAVLISGGGICLWSHAIS